MAKAKKFIPGSVVASVLAIPTVAFAHGNGPLAGEPVRAERVQLQQATYSDRTSARTQYSMNFQAAVARVEAQAHAFETYGGVSSSSAVRASTHVTLDKPIRFRG
ncbi:hypothetical protein Q8F57_044115 [Paraburkholderia terrae]|uniref:hypothetical protein n=1 Tax=Paraburkholderia terrae TaxID=311230 RepID=UPI00296B3742|nr:hypothetical protein [Paraburkholderia terrae]MDW3661872.1 hypothetical protein [Paraburkholderia terrae]